MEPRFKDPEVASEAGRKSGEARRRRAELSPEERAREAIDAKLVRLTNELIDAAVGLNDFDGLDLKTRVQALKTLMEWRLGRAASVKPQENSTESEPEQRTPTADDLFD